MLNSAVKKAAAAAFSAVSSLTIAAVYLKTQSTYNPSTGAVTSVTTRIPIRIVRDQYSQVEIDHVRVHATDIKALVLADELGVVPDKGTDTVSIAGVVHNIPSVPSLDPAGAVWTLQLRVV